MDSKKSKKPILKKAHALKGKKEKSFIKKPVIQHTTKREDYGDDEEGEYQPNHEQQQVTELINKPSKGIGVKDLQQQQQQQQQIPLPPPPLLEQSEKVQAFVPKKKILKQLHQASKNDYHSEEFDSDDEGEDLDDVVGLGRNNLHFTAKDLLQAKKKLKPNSIKPKVTLHREKLFDIYNVNTHYPLEKIQGMFVVDNFIIDKLDFSGVEQLSDMFFHCVLLIHGSSIFLHTVEHISIQGCIHITDVGVSWISQLFPNLKSISVNSCYLVTEQSLSSVLPKCKAMELISAKATDVGIVPTPEHDNIYAFKLFGCPLLSPPHAVMDDTDTIMGNHNYLKILRMQPVYAVYKAVILNDLDTPVSLVQSLADGKMVEMSTARKNFSIGEITLTEDCTLNLMECTGVFLDLVSSDRTLYVLTYNASLDCSASLSKQILHLKYKFPFAVFVLVGIAEVDGKSTISELHNKIKSKRDDLNVMASQITQNVFVDRKEMLFPEQTRVAHLINLRDQIHLIDEGLEKIEIFVVPGVLSTKGNKNLTAFKQTLIKATRRLRDLHPIYKYMPPELLNMFTSIDRKPGITSDTQFVRILRHIHRGVFGPKAVVYHKALKLMHKLGYVLYIKSQNEGHVITDLKWFSELLQKLTEKKQTAKVASKDVFLVHPETKIICYSQVREVLTKSMDSKQMHDFRYLLKDVGLVFEVPHTGDLLLASDLTTRLPISLSHYLDQRAEVSSLKMSIHVPTGLPHYLWPVILITVCNIHRPDIMSCNSVVIQDSPVVIHISIEDEGHTICFELQSAMSMQHPDTEEEKHLKKQWNKDIADVLANTLSMYQIPIQYYLHRWNIFYEIEKMTGKNVVMPTLESVLDSPVTSHVLAPCADNESIVCNTCGMQPKILNGLWHQYKSVSPSFISDSLISATNLLIGGNKGNIVVSALGRGVIFPLRKMSPCDFDEFRVTSFNESGFGLAFMSSVHTGSSVTHDETTTVKNRNELFAVDVCDGKIKVVTWKKISKTDSSDEQWISELQILEDTVFTIGDTLIAKIKVDKIQLQYSIELLGGDVLCSETVPSNSVWIPSILTYGQVKQHINCSMAPDITTEINTWEIGMRLEAVDKKNRHLVCVATVADKRDDGSVMIHFDGWGPEYDYWTETTDPDLHPIGFMDHLAKNNIMPASLNGHLQKPYGYPEEFYWSTYLKEEKSYPVPHQLFTEEQACGTPPTELPHDVLLVLASQAFNLLKSCQHQQKRPPYVQRVVTIKNEEARKDIPYVLLPRQLNATLLNYPALKSMWLTNYKIQLICNLSSLAYANPNIHIIGHDTIELPEKYAESTKDVLLCQSIQLITAGHLVTMIKQKNFLSSEVNKIADGVEKWTLSEVEKKLSEVFSLLIPLSGAFNITDRSMVKKLRQASVEFSSEILNTLHDNKVLGQHMIDEDLPQCSLHRQASSLLVDRSLNAVPMELFAKDFHLISKLNLEKNQIKSLPDDFFTSFIHLVWLNLSSNRLTHLPRGLGDCKRLEVLHLADNKLCSLSDDMVKLNSCLTYLDISRNPFHNIPSCVYSLTGLLELYAGDIILERIHPEIQNLKKLTVLDLKGNVLSELPDQIGELTNLEALNLSGVRYQPTNFSQGVVSLRSLREWIASVPILNQRAQDIENVAQSLDVSGNGTLEPQDMLKFMSHLYNMFTRLEQRQLKDPNLLNKYGCCPPQLFNTEDDMTKFPNLRELDLSYQGLHSVVGQFCQLTGLTSLILSHNPRLTSISGDISLLKHLNSMPLRDCPQLKTPPHEIVSRGFKAVQGYLRRIKMGSVECKRTKLMMVGLGGAGKTSLVRALRRQNATNESKDLFDNYLQQRYGNVTEGITDGIDITDWNVKGVTFSMWDFAGQTVYYNTHQFFMSNRAVYLLLWNIRLGYEHGGLEFWLSSIACHAPKAPILVVGTHRDQVEKYWLPETEIRAKYPQIQGFYAISCPTGKGVPSLAENIVSVALKEKYMGEQIPEAWLNFECSMLKRKAQHDFLAWDQVLSCAEECGIIDKSEVIEGIRFLHELGSVQHFQSNFLRDRVIINPQWIVDAMACVVSVHDTPIKDGKLMHSEISKVWKDFPSDLHHWLLRLTEEFDLTFPMKVIPANIVPCLLPATPPDFEWPNISHHSGYKEIKMLYKFDYLPAGLFNRVQVRLYQYSDSSIIWKYGSLLKKNMHKALLRQDHNSVYLKVQGPRPENVKFMVHEVFESLIAESFHGVSYDYFVPCSDCVKALSQDPSLFPASKIHRATELKVPFLQCDKLFHTLSLHELHAVMPPDSSTDYDIHLERSLRELDDLSDDLSYDIIIIYNNKDIPGVNEEEKRIHPQRIKRDLVNNGYKVWFPYDPSQIDLQKESITIRRAKIVIICISNNFVADPHSSQLFYYITKNLQKDYQLVALGENYDWKQTDIGMLVTADVYINMMDAKRYEFKIQELLQVVRKSIEREKKNLNAEKAQCFISYCWSNSAEAVKKGTKSHNEALGYGDPRAFKTYLEEHKIKCWIDVDNVGKGSLFEEIAEGLKHAKVMLVCVSDEYVTSRNCQVEFRFAAVTLKIPMVIAVVGTGYTWETSEIGMLSLGFPKINLQYETPDGMQRLLEAVRNHIPEIEQTSSDMPVSSTPTNNNELAFQELLELAQRKFLRQLSSYADSLDSNPYPRLLMVDFYREDEKQKESEEQMKIGKEQCQNLNEADTNVEKELPNLKEHKEDGQGEQKTCRPASSLGSSRRPGSSSSTKQMQHMKKRPTKTAPGPHSQFCIRFLCEHEEGWHDTDKILPFSQTSAQSLSMDTFLDEVAPYMARLYAILKHANLNLPAVKTERGEHLWRSFIQKCGLESEFQNEYLSFRKYVMEIDQDMMMCGLVRCHLASGKVLWLCEEHQKLERVTIMSEETCTVLDRDLPQHFVPTVSRQEEHFSKAAKLNEGEESNNQVNASVAAQYKQSTGRKLSTLFKRGTSVESSTSNQSSENTHFKKVVVDIMSQGVTKGGSKACHIM